MAPRTRSTTSSPIKKASSGSAVAPFAQEHEPHKILLLPTDLSSDARVVSLLHPRDGSRKRFLFCPSKGLYEFTRVAAPTGEYGSILIEDETLEEGPSDVEFEMERSYGYISKDAQILIATPFDTMFLLLPLLPSSLRSSGKVLFQPLDDLLESHVSEDKHLSHIIQHGRQYIERRLESFCDTVDAGDEKMFRVSQEKTVRSIAQKVKHIVQCGLPPSLEERFVSRSLEAPVLSLKREDSSVSTTIIPPTTTPDNEETKSESFDSQSIAASSAPSMVFSEVSIASSVTTVEPNPVTENIKHLQRLRIVLKFILASCTSPALSEMIESKIQEMGLLADFEPLDQHLTHLAELKAEAAASRSLNDFSRKRGNADDDEVAEARAEKKRRLEEDEKRKKAGESQGVRNLKKVNVSGMKKMSDFFGKKPVTAKAKS